jgi:SAM-dependent methyltransferase
MPVDREEWFSQLNLSNFINSYYQYRDLLRCAECTNVLIVGPGQGLDRQVLSWRGYRVTTLDIDDTFRPDHVGSIHDMAMFVDGAFDAVIVSHVLEHLAVPYLDRALGEIARVGRHALVYLPVAGRHGQCRFTLGIRDVGFSLGWDLFNYFRKPDGTTPAYCGNQHFWELGMRGYRVKDLTARMSRHFEVIAAYRNHDWLPSYNFVLKSRGRSSR